MHVLIAADAFGATLGPRTTGDALAAGWARGAPHDTVEVRPLSDGGHGFVALVGDALGVRPEPDGVLVVPGTHGTSTVYIDGHGCIDAGRSSAWLAEQIEHALSLGATRIVVGLPGPHETVRGPDAGAALLGALGALAPERHGRWTGRLGAVTASDLGGLAAVRERLRGVDLVGATASDVPLLGLHGASASAAAAGVLGAQEAHDLEREIGHFAHVVRGILAPLADLRRPLPLAGSTRGDGARADVARALTTGAGTGAAGGLGFALCALGGRLVPGADVFGDTARVSERAERADLVLTARGELDGSSFQGSALAVAVRAAAQWGVPCLAVAGTSLMSRREQASAGLSALSELHAGETPATGDPRGTVEDLDAQAERLARTWSPARLVTRT